MLKAVEQPLKKSYRPLANYVLIFLFGATLTGGIGLLVFQKDAAKPAHVSSANSYARKAETLERLLSLPPEQLAQVDIAEMNLLCATGLPGAEDMDIEKCLAKLDQWAQHVKHETERHLYRLTDPRYKDHAEHYQHSEARFRAEWLISVLQRDIGLHYHAGFVPQDVDVPPFKTAKETFLHGLMDNDDAHKAFGGNCVSLPVAYAAVGRRLGYPIKLVSSKEHVFCRWEGMDNPNPAWRDRFNFDGAGAGFSIDPDEFYLSWPRPTTPEIAKMGDWLTSLTPAKELALFLLSRGAVIECVNKDYAAAQVAYAHAAQLWPVSRRPLTKLSGTLDQLTQAQLAANPEILRMEMERRRSEAKAGQAQKDTRSWWQTSQGRADNLAEIERINEENRRNMLRTMQPQQPPQPYRPPEPGVPQPYQPPAPGQPPR